MQRRFVSLLMVVLATSLLAGCAQPTPTTAPAPTQAPVVETVAPTEQPTIPPTEGSIVVTDALGRTVEFDQLPTRIVIAGKAAFMINNAALLFPDAPGRIVAFVPSSQTSNDFATSLYPQTGNMTRLETESGPEQIAPLNPDLVILKSFLKDSLGDPIEKLGIKVVYLNLETPEAIVKDLRTLGQIFGNPAKAEEVVSLIDQNSTRVTDVTSKLTDDQKPTVLMLQYSNKGGDIAFKVPPVDWLQTAMVEMAGGIPVWKDVPTDGWTTITLEQIASWNPQVIFIVDYKGNASDVVSQLKTEDKWALLDAVKNEKLFAFPSDYQSWDQPDMRWPLGLTWIATKLQPESFKTIDMNSEIKAFYINYYGIDESTFTGTILPLVKGDL